MAQNEIAVEVVYCHTPTDMFYVALKVHAQDTILAAIQQSGVLDRYPSLALQPFNVGIFGKKKCVTDLVQKHARIEIYRPLKLDPKEIRRRKANLKT